MDVGTVHVILDVVVVEVVHPRRSVGRVSLVVHGIHLRGGLGRVVHPVSIVVVGHIHLDLEVCITLVFFLRFRAKALDVVGVEFSLFDPAPLLSGLGGT